MSRIRNPSLLSLLSLQAAALATQALAPATEAPSFSVDGHACVNPWTFVNHLESDRAADDQASARCGGGPAKRLTDFEHTERYPGSSDRICPSGRVEIHSSALYQCDSDAAPRAPAG